MPTTVPMPTRALVFAAIASAAVCAGASSGADDRAEVVIRGIGLVDVTRGVVLPARDIAIRGTRIATVQPTGGAMPPAKTLIDGRGKFALPGLIAAHVSLARFTRDTAATLLAHGITAVRDVGTDPARIAEWRRALAHGRMYAPRIARACGAGPGAPVGPGVNLDLRAVEPGCETAAPSGASALAALLRGLAELADGRAGTPGVPGPGVHHLLEHLVRPGGLTPAEVLRAATIETARLLVLPDLGDVAVGKGADIVITTANPLDDIRNARAIDAVVFRGEPLTQAHLNLLRAGRMPRAATLPQAR